MTMGSRRPMQPTSHPTRTLTRCLVCGSAEVRTDEVVDRGLVFLAECPRCEHRWTRARRSRRRRGRPPRSAAGATPREVASAA